MWMMMWQALSVRPHRSQRVERGQQPGALLWLPLCLLLVPLLHPGAYTHPLVGVTCGRFEGCVGWFGWFWRRI